MLRFCNEVLGVFGDIEAASVLDDDFNKAGSALDYTSIQNLMSALKGFCGLLGPVAAGARLHECRCESSRTQQEDRDDHDLGSAGFLRHVRPHERVPGLV